MKLSAWARRQGVRYNTALRWVTNNTMPVAFERTATGTILVKEFFERSGNFLDRAALYARVSGAGQKSELEAQLGRISVFAASKKLRVVASVGEIGSGLNGHRPKLMKLLADPSIKTIVIEHRDRLMRFGVEYLECSLQAQGRGLIIADQGEGKDDLVADMIEVLTTFCARLYGRRSAKNKAQKALKAVQE
jgi:predicted site-specific integrase-resolvase